MALGAFDEVFLRTAGFLAGAFFFSDLTVTDFVRVVRTGFFGASVLLLWVGRSDARDDKVPSDAHHYREAERHVVPKPVLPLVYRSQRDSRHNSDPSMIWFTA